MSAVLLSRLEPLLPVRGSVLDLGAGPSSFYAALMGAVCSRVVLCDAHQPYLDAHPLQSAERVQAVAPGGLARFSDGEFDLALAIDFIEHLDEEDAAKTLAQLKRVARAVVLFTPDGFHAQTHDHYGLGAEAWQTHRTGWSPEKLAAAGFTVEILLDFHWQHPEAPHALWATWEGPCSS